MSVAIKGSGNVIHACLTFVLFNSREYLPPLPLLPGLVCLFAGDRSITRFPSTEREGIGV